VDYFLISLLVVFLTLEHLGRSIQHKKIQHKKTKDKEYEENVISGEEDEPSQNEVKKLKEEDINNKDFNTEKAGEETSPEELQKLEEKPISILDEKHQDTKSDEIENKAKKDAAETFEKKKIIPLPQDKPFGLSTFKHTFRTLLKKITKKP